MSKPRQGRKKVVPRDQFWLAQRFSAEV